MMTTDNEALSKWMDDEGLSDGDLAAKVNRDRTRVLRWRKNKGRPDYEALAVLEELSGGRLNAKSFAGALEQ